VTATASASASESEAAGSVEGSASSWDSGTSEDEGNSGSDGSSRRSGDASSSSDTAASRMPQLQTTYDVARISTRYRLRAWTREHRFPSFAFAGLIAAGFDDVEHLASLSEGPTDLDCDAVGFAPEMTGFRRKLRGRYGLSEFCLPVRGLLWARSKNVAGYSGSDESSDN
jgi:hypothetical protein